MPKRKKLDLNQLAKSIVEQATSDAPKPREQESLQPKSNNSKNSSTEVSKTVSSGKEKKKP